MKKKAASYRTMIVTYRCTRSTKISDLLTRAGLVGPSEVPNSHGGPISLADELYLCDVFSFVDGYG
jgi:hypothetical protein